MGIRINTIRKLHGFVAVFLIFLLTSQIFIGVLAKPIEDFVLAGSFKDNFSLSSEGDTLFHVENIGPGSSWSVRLKVKNIASSAMEFSISEVRNNLKNDDLLFSALDLVVKDINGNIIYDGSYGETPSPLLDFVPVEPNQTIILDIDVSLDLYAKNNMQNRKMDSSWVFDARYYGNSSGGDGGSTSDPEEYRYTVKYLDTLGNELLPPKFGYAIAETKITETAPNIDGYVPDAILKTLLIKAHQTNLLQFIYNPTVLSEKIYQIFTTSSSGGTVQSDHETAKEGDLVTVILTPDKGYIIQNISIFTEFGVPIPFETLSEQLNVSFKDSIEKYTFIMPASDVFVSGVFEPEQESPPTNSPGNDTGNGDSPIQTGVELIKNNVMPLTLFVLGVFTAILGIVMWIKIYKGEKDDKNKQ